MDDAVRDVEWVVVGKRHESHPEPDVLRSLGGGGDADLGRVDRLQPGGVVLADPGFVEAEVVEELAQLQVSLECERRFSRSEWKGARKTPWRSGIVMPQPYGGRATACSQSPAGDRQLGSDPIFWCR